MLRRLVLTSGIASVLFVASRGHAMEWVRVTADAPASNAGVALLLSDGTVLALSDATGNDDIGDTWHKLTPDAHGSYVNGTWSGIAPMLNTREYFSSQVLMDGRVYVAGGEYGTGKAKAEVYNPLTNVWSAAPDPGGTVSDANSEMLPDGRVLQALVTGTLTKTRIYNPVTNAFSNGPECLGIHNESVWMKLADDSILFVDRGATTSERYIPSLNAWQSAGVTPVQLYDPWGLETGGALRLPDGRGFFIGSLSTSAFYVPGVGGLPGSWTAGPVLPNGSGAPDAPVAMMVDGKVLAALSPAPTPANHFPSPTSFYLYDAMTNAFTQIPAPGGGNSIDAPSYVFCFLVLPDGGILCTQQDSPTYYVWVSNAAPLAVGRPVLSGVVKTAASTYQLSGTGFNGISEGASYGDDWQMNTNYPIARLTSANGKMVRYARTSNWNSTGVATGSLPTTTSMTLPPSLAPGSYSLAVVANGIASTPVSFVVTSSPCVADLNADGVVNGADLALLLGQWGSIGGADFDASGAVDGADLALVLGAWGACPS
ncbi:MAG: hypothetical protein JNL80_03125 [Phycisphaerae bacterium]|jgi:hypothetical protein|nr:hypothetical protein [Phycisphaerae bacterium]